MKSYYKFTIVILIMNTILFSCSVKSSAPNSTTIANPSTTNSGGTTSGTATSAGSSSTTGGITCDGVNNNTGATRCYYKNLPTIQIMGSTSTAISSGAPLWSSVSLDAKIPQQQFKTDAIFNVRIIPRMAIKTNPAVNPSVPNKTCNHVMTKIATKLFIQLKLQTKEESTANSAAGDIATLSANIDEPSTVWHFARRPTATNLVLKVVNVLTDSRCQQGGTGYCPYSDLPLNSPTTTAPTECVAFDIQYSTDETYDLPGASAN